MPSLRSLVLALAVNQAFAAPTASNSRTVEKRQSETRRPGWADLSDLKNMVGWDGWKAVFPDWKSFADYYAVVTKASTDPGNFLGKPEATDTLITWARLMGATKNTPGLLNLALDAVNYGATGFPEPAGVAPRKPAMKSRTSVPGAETVKIRYGPYRVPNMGTKNLMGQAGMLFNLPNRNMEKPCQGACTLLGMSSGLEYPDGRSANVNEGLWLHHLILFNSGPGRSDVTCKQRDVSIPHVSIGRLTSNTERIFAAGNERVDGILPFMNITDAGYKLYDTDQFSALIELMNENMEDKTVYLTMTYDIVRGHPYKDDIKILWMDVRQCGTSEVNPPKGQNKFMLEYKWMADFDAELVGTIGHVHDGGTHTTLSVDGKETCRNDAQYGGKPEYYQAVGGGHTNPPVVTDAGKENGAHGHGAEPAHAEMGPFTHLNDIHVCFGSDIKHREMRKGQEWKLQAFYDFDKNKGMRAADGEWDGVMGISVVFVRVKGKN